jgi:hypothetical protein
MPSAAGLPASRRVPFPLAGMIFNIQRDNQVMGKKSRLNCHYTRIQQIETKLL